MIAAIAHAIIVILVMIALGALLISLWLELAARAAGL